MLTSMPLACDVRDGPFATSPDYTSDRTFLRKPYAGNLHVRFEEEEGPTSVGPPYSTVFRGSFISHPCGTGQRRTAEDGRARGKEYTECTLDQEIDPDD